MKERKSAAARLALRVSLLVAFLTLGNFGWTQTPNNLPLDQFKLAKQNIPAYHQQFLSSTALNMFQLVDTFSPDQPGPDGGFGAFDKRNLLDRRSRMAAKSLGAMTPEDTLSGGPVPVSNPGHDFLLSAIAGFTQSETSPAWCGNSMVVGFNDSGSFLETLSSRARSFSGVAFSPDGGATFTDIGALNPGTNFGDFIEGDAVVACTSNRRFLYSNLFATSTTTHMRLTAISLSTSTNGGHTWFAPVAAVSKSALTHFLDKDWMTVDPMSPLRTYISYTDFDFSGTSPACPPGVFRNAIELVSSANGGVTFSAPVVIKEVCGGASAVQGSNIAVAADGSVYVAFEFFQGANREIHIRKSTDHGITFGSEVTISTVVPTGGAGLLQGGFRTNEFPSLAVDLTSGQVYAAFTTANSVALDSFTGSYGYGDVVISTSMDGGLTWSTPTVVSPVDPAFAGIGRDQFMPGVAVDSTGNVAVCYYDRRNDPSNIAIDRFCSVSTNHAASFTDQQVTLSSWLPFHATDRLINLVYMGDYDGLTTDSTHTNTGFFGAFQIQTGINPDVFSTRF